MQYDMENDAVIQGRFTIYENVIECDGYEFNITDDILHDIYVPAEGGFKSLYAVAMEALACKDELRRECMAEYNAEIRHRETLR